MNERIQPAAGKPELTLSVPSGGTERPDIQSAVATSRSAKRPTPDQVAAKRAALHAASLAGAEHQAAQEEAQQEPAAPREDIESLEIALPNGTLVHFGPPAGVALQMRIASILGQTLNEYTAGMCKTVMSIRSIDGKTIPPVGNLVDVQRVANMVGEEGVDLLMMASATYWPAVTIADLQIVKKNLR